MLRHGVYVVSTLLALAGWFAPPAHAQIGSDRYAALVMDAERGTVLIAASADEPRYPASLTKMMTLYMAFEALRDRRISMATPIAVSAAAAAMPPSRLGLLPGLSLSVEEAILALITKSANDAAAALGEHLGGGSEYRFAQLMTLRARSLGMTRTTFRNASGLPDPEQVSTARDMAVLGRRLVQDFPDRYPLFSVPHFSYRGRIHYNHNRLLSEYDGMDGIKTGYVNDSGFNLVASTQRDGVRLVAAVFGGRTGRERDRHMVDLLDTAFERMGVAPRPPLLAAARVPMAPIGGPVLRGLTLLAPAQAATTARRTASARSVLAAARAPTPVGGRGTAGRPVAARVLAAPALASTVARPAGRPTAATLLAPGPLRRADARPSAERSRARVEQGDGGRAARGQPVAAARPGGVARVALAPPPRPLSLPPRVAATRR